jgi:uncharacterized membrane protein
MSVQPRHRRTIGNRLAPPRFLIFLALLGIVGGSIQIYTGQWQYAVMIGFDAAALVFLGALWPVFRNGSATEIRRHAADNDANRGFLLVLAALLSLVLMVTIWVELKKPGEPLAALIIATLIIAWLFANILYTLHYAHMFYGEGHGGSCLTFPGTDTPDYWDFAYFALTLGMTFQTSDVSINGRAMRRLVLFQCLASFVFNIGILAFTINTLGGGADQASNVTAPCATTIK